MNLKALGLLAMAVLWASACSLEADSSTPTIPTDRNANLDLPTYYMYNGVPVELSLDLDRVAIKLPSAAKADRFAAALSQTGIDPAGIRETSVSGWFLGNPSQVSNGPAEINNHLQSALQSATVEFASPVLIQPNGGWMVVTQDILVRFRPEHRKEARALLESAVPQSIVSDEKFGGMDGAFKLHCNSRNGFEVLALANRLALDSTVEWAEPDMLATLKSDLTPNDPGWSTLWGLNNTGQSGGTVNMDMNCDLAWDITTGSPTVKVLVLDDGADLFHPDLNIGGGADFTGSGTGGGPLNSCDDHATAVSGCVSAIINNGIGTIGAAPGCQVLSAKYTIANVPCDGSGTFQFSWLVSALTWGQSQGARVSNNSNGLPVSSSVTAKYQDTYAAGMVHFASAGNDGIESIGYPASLPVVNAISAINRNGVKASFSSYGAGLSLAAPGQAIYTTDRTGAAGYNSGNYVTADGTSFSSPYAAGVAALLLSVDPTLTAVEVENQLHATATDLGAPGFDNLYGYGLVNAFGAVAHAQFDITADVDLGTAPLTVNFTGTTARPVTGWSWIFGDGGTSTEQNPSHVFLSPGYYTVEATIDVSGQFYTKSVPGMISIYADTLSVGNSRFDGNVGHVDVLAHDYVPLSEMEIPFAYSGPMTIFFDSVTVTGLRSSFMSATVVSRVDFSKLAAVNLKAPSGQYLAAGSGPLASLWFHRSGSSVGTTPVQVTNYSNRSLKFIASAGQYVPVSLGGTITASCCQGIVGDVNDDGTYEPTIADVSWLIAHLFIDGAPIYCYLEADANQSGGLNPTNDDLTIGDISVLIDYLFITGTPLPNCL